MDKLFENIAIHSNYQVTFIIGNGFDLGLGMKTSYNDIYEGYVNTSSATEVIRAFKTDLLERKPYDKWSDFEMGMAEYAKTLLSENELIECVRDFKRYMVSHLKHENDKMIKLIRDDAYSNKLLKELNRSLEEFYGGFTPNVISQLRQLQGGPFVEYNVITFNYTKIIEELFALKFREQKVMEKSPLHIHGSLDRDVVMGVDNISQLHDLTYNISKKGERAFIKTVFNEQYDNERVLAAKKMISESSIICTYGFSLGKSDKIWVDLLGDWLVCDSSHHLVIYQYDKTEYGYYNFDELMDIEELKKEKLIEQFEIKESDIFNRIHIPVGYDIFNFEFTRVIENPLPKSTFNIFDANKR